MDIKLKKAWLVKGDEIIIGFGFETNSLSDGGLERKNISLFTEDGLNFTQSSWYCKILFDELHANICVIDNKKERLSFLEQRIEESKKELEKLKLNKNGNT